MPSIFYACFDSCRDLLPAESGKTQDARGAVLFASVLQSRVDFGHRNGALGRDAHAFARAGTAHVCLARCVLSPLGVVRQELGGGGIGG